MLILYAVKLVHMTLRTAVAARIRCGSQAQALGGLRSLPLIRTHVQFRVSGNMEKKQQSVDVFDLNDA